ncbi:hypothetical protein RUM44_001431 [Polyplax serrata]|uniref:Uncharacterized protein n=1 Tax=Polyplax serrata TaxID=468196 RepID=A0ABR1ALH7_POLSC
MFSDSNVNVVGFPSSREEERVTKCSGNQTEKIEMKDDQTNTATSKSAGIQTIPAANINAGGNTNISYDSERLAIFLKRILPHLEEELKDCAAAEDDVSNPNNDYNGEDQNKAVALDDKQIVFKPKELEGKIVSSLAWNSNGVSLAIAFCQKSHEGWCSHESTVKTYNTSKIEFEKLQPSHILKTNSCVQYVRFHPYSPSVLTAGLHNGDIVVWDLANEDEVSLSKEKGEGDTNSHTGPVTHLTWIECLNGLRLVTLGRDGRILFWRVTLSNLTYHVDERFVIFEQQSSVPGTFKDCIEVNCIGFWKDKKSDMIVAAGDKVFHCCWKSARSIASVTGYKDPVTMTYTAHKGITTYVSCLSESDIFASSGIDGEIHSNPLFTISTTYAVMGIFWTGPTCLASWGSSNSMDCHKVNLEQKLLATTTSCQIGRSVITVDYNVKR